MRQTLIVTDKWILSKVNTLAKDVTENMDKFELGIAVQKVYDFIWDEFCDWYIELVKYRIYHSDEELQERNAALWTLKTVLGNALKTVTSIYAICNRRNLQRTGTGGRISDDVRLAAV